MKKTKLFLILATAIMLIMTSCSGAFVDPGMQDNNNGISGGGGSSGDGDYYSGGGSGGGSLKGTNWENRRYDTSFDAYGFKNNITTTITFTSEDRLTMTYVGWSDFKTQTAHVNNDFSITYTEKTERTNYNDTYNGTYTYYSDTKEGYINCNYWDTMMDLRILSDNRTLLIGSTEFTKK